MTSTYDGNGNFDENSGHVKSVAHVAGSYGIGDNDDNNYQYDDDDKRGHNNDDGGEDGGEGGQDEEDPSSRVDSERTNSTTTTVFSASSLPSLEGIDLVSATRPSFSSLPPNDDDNDGDDTMEPSTVVTEDPHNESSLLSSASHRHLYHHLADDSKRSRTTVKPLGASPRLPTAAYGNQLAGQSNVGVSSLSPRSRKKRDSLAITSPSSCSVSVNSSTTTWTLGETPLRKRTRRIDPGTENNHQPTIMNMATTTTTTTTIPQRPSVDVMDAVSLASSHPPTRDTIESYYPTSSVPLNLQHHSKHDEKWFGMFEQLKEYQRVHGNTSVPQTFAPNRRLGRWVHYQRVEYWVFKQKGKAKINAERIKLLDSIGFEWDPQKVQWRAMYKKLCQFVRKHGHAKVPKGYLEDTELANWVRNQRLEHRNWGQGKRSGMTSERFDLLDELGFVWSTLSPKKNTQTSSDSSDQRKGCEIAHT